MFTWLAEYEFIFYLIVKLFLLSLLVRGITLAIGIGGYIPFLDDAVHLIVHGMLAIMDSLAGLAPVFQIF